MGLNEAWEAHDANPNENQGATISEARRKPHRAGYCAALEAAAKTQCPKCAAGETPVLRQKNWCHGVFVCRANRIRALRGEEQRDD